MSAAISTRVARTDSPVQVIPARPRYGISVFNGTDATLYARLGGVVTTTLYTVAIPPEGLYEEPYGYSGELSLVWAADGAGYAFITEVL